MNGRTTPGNRKKKEKQIKICCVFWPVNGWLAHWQKSSFPINIKKKGVFESGKFYPKKVIQKKLSTKKSQKKIYPEVLSKIVLSKMYAAYSPSILSILWTRSTCASAYWEVTIYFRVFLHMSLLGSFYTLHRCN